MMGEYEMLKKPTKILITIFLVLGLYFTSSYYVCNPMVVYSSDFVENISEKQILTSSEEILENGSFENGVNPWINFSWTDNASVDWPNNVENEGVFSIDSTQHYIGLNSIKLASKNTSTSVSVVGLQKISSKVVPGKKYILTGLYRTDNIVENNNSNSSGLGVYFYAQKAGNVFRPFKQIENINLEENRIVGTNGWTEFKVIYKLPVDSEETYVVLYLSNATGTAWLDDLKISEVPIIQVSLKAQNIHLGETYTLSAVCSQSTLQANYEWVSSNSNVATVDSNGKVTAIAIGKAEISFMDSISGEKDSCNVAVVPDYAINNIQFKNSSDGQIDLLYNETNIKATAIISNYAQEDKNLNVVVALYRDAKLVEAFTSNIKVNAKSESNFEKIVELNSDAKNIRAKMFIWDDFNNIIPILNGFKQIINNDEKVLYVSNITGADSNEGTYIAPFKTLAGVRDYIRNNKNGKLIDKDITVYLRGGTYKQTNTFTLGENDSLANGKVITYESYPGEIAVITGGYEISGELATNITDNEMYNSFPVNARDKIKEIDLASTGIIDFENFAPIKWSKWNEPISSNAELFIDNVPQIIARWPNSNEYTLTKNVTDSGSVLAEGDTSQRGAVFGYTDERISNWDTNDIWVEGYFNCDWAFERLKIDSINTSAKQITTVNPHTFGVGNNKRIDFLNVKEELDIPGEWYLNRNTGKLYVYPNKEISNETKIQLSFLGNPLIQIADASNIKLKNLTFEATCGYGIVMYNSTNINISNSVVRNIGMIGISADGGKNAEILDNKIYNVGANAVSVFGGDRISLIPSNHYVKDNDIYSYGRISRAWSTGISLSGVGNKASNNRIHDAPHMGIYFWGNDNSIEYNEIYNVCNDTSDAGAIYSGRDWTFRGNQIKYNYIHDVISYVYDSYGETVRGIYLDDMMSSANIFGNVLENISEAMLIGGGHDQIIENNMIINCVKNIRFDNRGETWANSSTLPPNGVLYKNLIAVPYNTSQIWIDNYPKLQGIMLQNPEIPKGNYIRNNLSYKSGEVDLSPSVISYGTVSKNWDATYGLAFYDELNKDYRIVDYSEINKIVPMFLRIPLEKIGLHNN